MKELLGLKKSKETLPPELKDRVHRWTADQHKIAAMPKRSKTPVRKPRKTPSHTPERVPHFMSPKKEPPTPEKNIDLPEMDIEER